MRGRSRQPDAGPRQHADADREDELHHASGSTACAVVVRAARSLRIDWWARAISISTVAPTTRREDAEVEEEGGGRRHGADQRQLDILRIRRQERIAEQPGRHAGRGGEQKAEADPVDRQDAQPSSTQRRAGGQVLQDEGGRQGDAGDKAAARQVVAAHEQIERPGR